MKKYLLSAAFVIVSLASWSQGLVPQDEGSSVTFTIRNFGVKVNGTFTGLAGGIQFNPKDLSTARFEVSVSASTVNTGIDLRDKHLKKEEYLDVEHFPIIRFVSKGVAAGAAKENFTITGDLSMKGKTKQITFPFTARQSEGATVFTGTFQINRKDFDIGGGFSMADELIVQLSVRATSDRM